MRVEKNITVFTGDTRNEGGVDKAQRNDSAQEKKNKTIFAGDLKGDFNLRDRIQQKKEDARKQAMKLVSDAWNSEQAIEDDLNSRRRHIKELEQQNEGMLAEIKDIEKQQEDLKGVYGVADDSQEQKDLEILRKRKYGDELTKEETKRYGEIASMEPTEYQLRQLELDGLAQDKRLQIEKNEQGIIVENAVIRGTKQELRGLKRSPMQDATAQAQKIMEAASDEIVGMVMQDAKEHLDEEQAEREEKAEDIKEQREEQEEILEKRQEREEELEELTEALPMDEMLKLEDAKTDLQQEVQNIVDKMKLVAEDIKGSMVDASI